MMNEKTRKVFDLLGVEMGNEKDFYTYQARKAWNTRTQEEVSLLLFSERRKLARIYEHWAKENNVKDCAESVIAFLCAYNLLNVENVLSFIDERSNGDG